MTTINAEAAENRRDLFLNELCVLCALRVPVVPTAQT
jgi:hypothetical protein